MDSVCRRTESAAGSDSDPDTLLLSIQKELEALKQRRLALEEQRKKLLSSCGSTATEALTQNNTQLTRANSSHTVNRSVYSHSNRIPSEAERLRSMKKNVFSEMKESMRKSWERDSALVMGTFLLEDNPHACTFGRERRFVPIADHKGHYYLSTDMEIMQAQKNKLLNKITASSRGGRGMNVSNHWNDLQCSGPPGPGAYTPRYGKLSKPSILARRQQPWKMFLLGWPALVVTWVYIIWFVSRILECWSRPIVRGSRSVVDPGWYVALLPSMCPPVIFVGVYGSWIGWKFFRHN
ncbi:Phosphatidylinositol N-acetylglucosaminyltransferase subunit Y [Trypanosoma melophagium]|uniref:Phosphatidylinositol N-acetylglucosaminyltransferase subunit Y n=1 Tax=Trypanosoma melophagium TaxID=715481 RepID=UPI003519FB81|nr:Phosphatidylinositol N-acetylglucosaminyltransferase subunit Y [Trypanosoma melophagium]